MRSGCRLEKKVSEKHTSALTLHKVIDAASPSRQACQSPVNRCSVTLPWVNLTWQEARKKHSQADGTGLAFAPALLLLLWWPMNKRRGLQSLHGTKGVVLQSLLDVHEEVELGDHHPIPAPYIIARTARSSMEYTRWNLQPHYLNISDKKHTLNNLVSIMDIEPAPCGSSIESSYPCVNI